MEALTPLTNLSNPETTLNGLLSCKTPQDWYQLLSPNQAFPAWDALLQVQQQCSDPDLQDLFTRALGHLTEMDRRPQAKATAIERAVALNEVKRGFDRALARDYPYEIPDVTLHIGRSKQCVEVTNTMKLRPVQAGAPLVLRGDNLELLQLRLNRKELKSSEFELREGCLIIKHPPEEEFELLVKTKVTPKDGPRRHGLVRPAKGIHVLDSGKWALRQLTYVAGPASVRSRFRTELTVDPKFSMCLASGDLEDGKATVLEDGRHRYVYNDPMPKSAHMFAVAIGKHVRVEREVKLPCGRLVTVELYVRSGMEKQCGLALEMIAHALRFDQETYGPICDKNVVRLVAVPGDMEESQGDAGCMLLPERLLLWPENAKIYHGQMRKVVYQILSRYATQRIGGRVGLENWSQLGLMTGLADLMAREAMCALSGGDAMHLGPERLKNLALTQHLEASKKATAIRLAQWEQPEDHQRLMTEFKAPEVFVLLRTAVGKKAWTSGVRRFCTEFDRRSARIEDFLAVLGEVAGKDLSAYKLWFDEPGAPKLQMEATYDQAGHSYRMTFKQETDGRSAKPIPIKVTLYGEDGAPLKLVRDPSDPSLDSDYEHVLQLSEQEQTFTFINVQNRPVPSVMRGSLGAVAVDVGYAQLAKFGHAYSLEDWLVLMQHDSNLENRFEAARRVIMHEIGRAGLFYTLPDAVKQAFQSILDDPNLSDAVKAVMLRLPQSASECSGWAIPGNSRLVLRRDRFGNALAQALDNNLLTRIQLLGKRRHTQGSLERAGEGDLHEALLRYLSCRGQNAKIYLQGAFLHATSPARRELLLRGASTLLHSHLLGSFEQTVEEMQAKELRTEVQRLKAISEEIRDSEQNVRFCISGVPLIGYIQQSMLRQRRLEDLAHNKL